jgi:hypothetical protein
MPGEGYPRAGPGRNPPGTEATVRPLPDEALRLLGAPHAPARPIAIRRLAPSPPRPPVRLRRRRGGRRRAESYGSGVHRRHPGRRPRRVGPPDRDLHRGRGRDPPRPGPDPLGRAARAGSRGGHAVRARGARRRSRGAGDRGGARVRPRGHEPLRRRPRHAAPDPLRRRRPRRRAGRLPGGGHDPARRHAARDPHGRARRGASPRGRHDRRAGSRAHPLRRHRGHGDVSLRRVRQRPRGGWSRRVGPRGGCGRERRGPAGPSS